MSNRRKHPKSTSEVELRPDGWQRFETAISAAVKSGPQHRTGIKPSALKKTARPKRR
jgi:hypothetical protein